MDAVIWMVGVSMGGEVTWMRRQWEDTGAWMGKVGVVQV